MNAKRFLLVMLSMGSIINAVPNRTRIQIINNNRVDQNYAQQSPESKEYKPTTFKKMFNTTKKYIKDNPYTVAIVTYLLINTLINGRSGLIGSSIYHVSKETIQQPIGDIKYIIGKGLSFPPTNIVDAVINKFPE